MSGNGKPPLPRKGPGAPRLVWTPERLGAVCEELRKHRPLAVACRLQGHEPDSLEELMGRDAEVRALIEEARSCAQASLVDMMLAAGGKDGATVSKTTYMLGVLNPRVFRQAPQKVESEISGKDGAPLPSFSLSIEAARELAKKGVKNG